MSVGLVMAWDQRGGLLAGAGKFIQMLNRAIHCCSSRPTGDLRNVRLWDCTAETKLADLPTASESFVTCVDLGWVWIPVKQSKLVKKDLRWSLLGGREASLSLQQVLEMGRSGSLMLGLLLGKPGKI